jgi:DNA-binding transcriptional LysR family regulator
MLEMDLDDLRTFVALAATRSFSRTARELFLTQPGVTRRLQRLEQALGATLVDRRRRPLALTAAGLATLERSQQLLDGVEALRAVVQGDAQAQREFRIGVAHALTEFALASPVERAGRELPRVALLLATGWSRDLVARVRTGHVDAAFVLLPADESPPRDVEAEALAAERLVPIGPRRRAAGSAPPRSVRELDGADWILNPDGCAARASLLRLLAREQVRCRVAVETYTYELQLALVARGRGLGLVPERLLARSAHRAEVRPLAIRELRFPLRIWCLHRQLPGELSSALAPIVEELRRELEGAGRRRRCPDPSVRAT